MGLSIGHLIHHLYKMILYPSVIREDNHRDELMVPFHPGVHCVSLSHLSQEGIIAMIFILKKEEGHWRAWLVCASSFCLLPLLLCSV